MVLSRKQYSPTTTKKAGHASHKRFGATMSTAAATKKAGTMHMGGARKTKEHGETMHEICVACYLKGHKEKVRIDDVRKETFKGKGRKLRARLVGKCEHGHKWYRITKA
jgi:hypothetical protein